MKSIILTLAVIILITNNTLLSDDFEKLASFNGVAYDGIFVDNDNSYYFSSMLNYRPNNHLIQKLQVDNFNKKSYIQFDIMNNNEVFSYQMKYIKSRKQIMFNILNKFYFLNIENDQIVDSLDVTYNDKYHILSDDENMLSLLYLKDSNYYLNTYNILTKKQVFKQELKLKYKYLNPVFYIDYENKKIIQAGSVKNAGMNSYLTISNMDNQEIDTSFNNGIRNTVCIKISKDKKYMAVSTEDGKISIYSYPNIKLLNENQLSCISNDMLFFNNSNYLFIPSSENSANSLVYSISENKIIANLKSGYQVQNAVISDNNDLLTITYYNGTQHQIDLYKININEVGVENENLNNFNINDNFSKLEYYDYSGKLIISISNSEKYLLENLKSGIYLFKIYKNDLIIKSGKFINY